MCTEAGELVGERELTAQDLSTDSRMHPPLPLPGPVWFHMPAPPPGRDYRMVIEVLRPAQRWAGLEQTITARGVPCSMVLLAKYLAYGVAGVLSLAGLLLVFAARRFWHPKRVEPGSPLPNGV